MELPSPDFRSHYYFPEHETRAAESILRRDVAEVMSWMGHGVDAGDSLEKRNSIGWQTQPPLTKAATHADPHNHNNICVALKTPRLKGQLHLEGIQRSLKSSK